MICKTFKNNKKKTDLLRYNSNTIYPFKMYTPMAFSIFTKLYNHHHNLIRTFSSTHKEILYPLVVTP